MTTDRVLASFLEVAAEEAAACRVASDILALEARPGSGEPPDTYEGCFTGVEHLVRAADGIVHVSAEPVFFTIHFPTDYLRSIDPNLLFRVAFLRSALFHPNVRGVACLGPSFRPGTRLRALIQQLYGIVSSRVRATDQALDGEAAHYYLAHREQVDALRARPLWRRPVAATSRLEWIGRERP